MTDSGDLVLDGAPSGIPPAISEALDAYRDACHAATLAVSQPDYTPESRDARAALLAAILSALPSQPAPSGEALPDDRRFDIIEQRMTELCVLANDGGPAYYEAREALMREVKRLAGALSGLPQPTLEEVAWLIERDGGGVALWWTGDGNRPWSPEHAEAVRFARQRDAERVITGNAPLYRHSEREGFNIFLGAKATEHAWFAPPFPPTPTGEADRP